MARTNRFALWLLSFLAVASCLSVRAAEQGKLALLNLPERQELFIYVDGERVAAEAGVLALPPGWHEVQVEAPQSRCLFRRMVEMKPQGFRSLPLDLRPVVPLGPMRYPQAAAGPLGPRGPKGRPASPLAPETDPKALAGLLQEALSPFIDDLEARKAYLHTTLNERAGAPVPASFYYRPPMTQSLLPGPSGPLGPRGPAGVPGDALLLQTETGRSLLDEARRRLNLTPLEGELDGVGPRIERLTARLSNQGEAIPPARYVAIRTPQWKAELDQAIEQQKQAYERYLKEPGSKDLGLTPPGPPGPRGRRGENGAIPTEAKPIRLTHKQVEQVIALLAQDRYLQQRIQHVRADLGDLSLWATEAEQHLARGNR